MDSTRRSFLRRAGLVAASIPFIRGFGLSQSDVKNPHCSDLLMDLTGKPKGRGTLTVITGPHFAGKTTVVLHHAATVFFCEPNPSSVNVSLPTNASGMFFHMACALKGLNASQFENGSATPDSWQVLSTTLQDFADSRRYTGAQMYFQPVFSRSDEQIENAVNELGVGLIVMQSSNPRLRNDKSRWADKFRQLKENAVRHDVAIMTEYRSHAETRHDMSAWDEEMVLDLAGLGYVDAVVLVRRTPGSVVPEWRHMNTLNTTVS